MQTYIVIGLWTHVLYVHEQMRDCMKFYNVESSWTKLKSDLVKGMAETSARSDVILHHGACIMEPQVGGDLIGHRWRNVCTK